MSIPAKIAVMKQFKKLPKLSKGDQVAVISPSAGLPQVFPWVQDLGIERMRDVFGLKPVEYPTTRVMGSSLEDRAKDVMITLTCITSCGIWVSLPITVVAL